MGQMRRWRQLMIKIEIKISRKNAVLFDDDLVAIHKVKGNVKLDRFNFIGFFILQKFKLFMYKALDKMKGILSNTELGKLKDEVPNDTNKEACFLKAKAYYYTAVKNEEEKKSKGITNATIKNQITIEDCENTIYNRKSKYATN